MQWREITSLPTAGGVRLHLRRVVDPPAPPVLLLHGLGVAGNIWQAFARRLLPQLAAIAPDLRGHGQSDAPPDGYTPADYAADLIQLLTELAPVEDQIDVPVPVVGHSLGGLVGLTLADLRPDLVRWLVLLDPPVAPDLRNPEVASVFHLRNAPPGELETYLVGRNPGGGQLLAQSLAGLFRQASDAAFEAFLNPNDLDGEPPPRRVTEAVDMAARVRAPCLVVQADPDSGGILGDAAARSFVERLPDGRLIKIVGATHALHASHPAEVARAILDFARELG